MYMDHITLVGERVVMKMDKEARSWGRPGPKDGTEGTIIGRYRGRRYFHRVGNDRYFMKTPGVYLLDGAAQVKWDGVEEIMAAGYDAEAIDQKAYEARYQELWVKPTHEEGKCIIMYGYELDNIERIGDLPETNFWELDRVRYDWRGGKGEEGKVVSIMYDWYLDENGNNKDVHKRGSCYQIDMLGGGTMYLHDTELTLIERGNVWKMHHNEPVVFDKIEDEIQFQMILGEFEELKNPIDNYYATWTGKQVLESIRAGTVDCFSRGSGPFGGSAKVNAYRLNDRVVAEKARNKVIAEFAHVTDPDVECVRKEDA